MGTPRVRGGKRPYDRLPEIPLPPKTRHVPPRPSASDESIWAGLPYLLLLIALVVGWTAYLGTPLVVGLYVFAIAPLSWPDRPLPAAIITALVAVAFGYGAFLLAEAYPPVGRYAGATFSRQRWVFFLFIAPAAAAVIVSTIWQTLTGGSAGPGW